MYELKRSLPSGEGRLQDFGRMEMEYQTILTEQNGSVLKVLFNNPEKLNALTDTFLQEYTDLLNKIDSNDEVQVVILTGSGKAFIAGADITLMRTMKPAEAAEYSKVTTEVYRRMEVSKKIFIAAINGFAFGGGCEMTLACDLRIASKKQKWDCRKSGWVFSGRWRYTASAEANRRGKSKRANLYGKNDYGAAGI